MAVFTRFTAGLVLAYVATTSLLVNPVAALDTTGVASHNARVHKNRQINPIDEKRSPTTENEESASSEVKRDVDEVKKMTYVRKLSEDSESDSESSVDLVPRGSSGKAGLGWNDGPKNYMKNFAQNHHITWCYSWSPWPCCTGHDWCPEFIPMFWSEKQAGSWKSQVMKKKWNHILHVNEPDQSGQSAMSVGEAIRLWHKYIVPVNAKSKGAPAVTASPNGKKWIQKFVNECHGCNIGFIPFHYYGMDADDFINNVKWFHKTFPNHSIWVTEWGCQNYGNPSKGQCSTDKVHSFLKKTQAFLNSASYVGRYAYFGSLTKFPGNFNQKNRLITSSGATTDLGWQYINNA